MRVLVLIAVCLAAGCATKHELGWTRPAGAARYPPTDPDAVRILRVRPAGAEVLGQVHGVERDASAYDAACKRAAALGADAIVVLASGDEESERVTEPWPIQYIEADAIRSVR